MPISNQNTSHNLQSRSIGRLPTINLPPDYVRYSLGNEGPEHSELHISQKRMNEKSIDELLEIVHNEKQFFNLLSLVGSLSPAVERFQVVSNQLFGADIADSLAHSTVAYKTLEQNIQRDTLEFGKLIAEHNEQDSLSIKMKYLDEFYKIAKDNRMPKDIKQSMLIDANKISFSLVLGIDQNVAVMNDRLNKMDNKYSKKSDELKKSIDQLTQDTAAFKTSLLKISDGVAYNTEQIELLQQQMGQVKNSLQEQAQQLNDISFVNKMLFDQLTEVNTHGLEIYNKEIGQLADELNVLKMKDPTNYQAIKETSQLLNGAVKQQAAEIERINQTLKTFNNLAGFINQLGILTRSPRLVKTGAVISGLVQVGKGISEFLLLSKGGAEDFAIGNYLGAGMNVLAGINIIAGAFNEQDDVTMQALQHVSQQISDLEVVIMDQFNALKEITVISFREISSMLHSFHKDVLERFIDAKNDAHAIKTLLYDVSTVQEKMRTQQQGGFYTLYKAIKFDSLKQTLEYYLNARYGIATKLNPTVAQQDYISAINAAVDASKDPVVHNNDADVPIDSRLNSIYHDVNEGLDDPKGFADLNSVWNSVNLLHGYIKQFAEKNGIALNATALPLQLSASPLADCPVSSFDRMVNPIIWADIASRVATYMLITPELHLNKDHRCPLDKLIQGGSAFLAMTLGLKTNKALLIKLFEKYQHGFYQSILRLHAETTQYLTEDLKKIFDDLKKQLTAMGSDYQILQQNSNRIKNHLKGQRDSLVDLTLDQKFLRLTGIYIAGLKNGDQVLSFTHNGGKEFSQSYYFDDHFYNISASIVIGKNNRRVISKKILAFDYHSSDYFKAQVAGQHAYSLSGCEHPDNARPLINFSQSIDNAIQYFSQNQDSALMDDLEPEVAKADLCNIVTILGTMNLTSTLSLQKAFTGVVDQLELVRQLNGEFYNTPIQCWPCGVDIKINILNPSLKVPPLTLTYQHRGWRSGTEDQGNNWYKNRASRLKTDYPNLITSYEQFKTKLAVLDTLYARFKSTIDQINYLNQLPINFAIINPSADFNWIREKARASLALLVDWQKTMTSKEQRENLQQKLISLIANANGNKPELYQALENMNMHRSAFIKIIKLIFGEEFYKDLEGVLSVYNLPTREIILTQLVNYNATNQETFVPTLFEQTFSYFDNRFMPFLMDVIERGQILQRAGNLSSSYVDIAKIIHNLNLIQNIIPKDDFDEKKLPALIYNSYLNNDNQTIVELDQRLANFSAVDEQGQSAIMLAAKSCSKTHAIDVINKLIARNVTLNGLDHAGQSVLNIAMECAFTRSREEILIALLNGGATACEANDVLESAMQSLLDQRKISVAVVNHLSCGLNATDGVVANTDNQHQNDSGINSKLIMLILGTVAFFGAAALIAVTFLKVSRYLRKDTLYKELPTAKPLYKETGKVQRAMANERSHLTGQSTLSYKTIAAQVVLVAVADSVVASEQSAIPPVNNGLALKQSLNDPAENPSTLALFLTMLKISSDQWALHYSGENYEADVVAPHSEETALVVSTETYKFFDCIENQTSSEEGTWWCNETAHDQLTCINPSDTANIRFVTKLSGDSWYDCRKDTFECTDFQKDGIKIKHCVGDKSEYIEYDPNASAVPNSEMLPILTSAAASGFLMGAFPEAIGDTLEHTGLASPERAQQIKLCVNAVMILATGSWLASGASIATTTILKHLGVSETKARLAGNASAFLVNTGTNITPLAIAATSVNYAAARAGLFTEKKLCRHLVAQSSVPTFSTYRLG